ncbi:MAG: hypothetical protein IKT56_05985 [Clostridia bacterium]|nr:hypothetical protein [Clostridia bacterium]
MELTSKLIKEKAIEFGAAVCGIGTLDIFEGENPQRDPKSILPGAKCIVGFGIPVPRGLYHALETGGQSYTYTSVGVKMIEEDYAEIFLFKIGNIIEDFGYDACLQRSVPNLRIKGDKTTNPEVVDTYELIHAEAVAPGKPVPDVLIDFGKAAKACGIGHEGKSGRIINDKYGPYMRYMFIITDAPLECNGEYETNHCEGCDECSKACPGNAIDANGLDTWQCAVYYKGAHRSNRFMTDDFLAGDPERDDILDGKKRFDAESARKVIRQMHFLPSTKGYAACLCEKACDRACYKHIKGEK